MNLTVWHNSLMDYGSSKIFRDKIRNQKLIGGSKSEKKKKSGQFKNSNRDFRGRVIRYLTKNSQASKQQISKDCNIPEDKIKLILTQLIKDTLVLKKDKHYFL